MADADTITIPKAPLLSESPRVADCLGGMTPNAIAAVKAYWQRGFIVKIKPLRTELDSSGYTVIVCNYCETRGAVGLGQPQCPLTCPEHPSKSPPGIQRKYKAVRKRYASADPGKPLPQDDPDVIGALLHEPFPACQWFNDAEPRDIIAYINVAEYKAKRATPLPGLASK